LTEFTPLESRVMGLIPVLCSHCIKMKICYSRISRTFLSEGSIFLKNEFPIIFIGLAAFMNSVPDSTWTVWEKGRLPHIPEDLPSKFAVVRQRAISLNAGSTPHARYPATVRNCLISLHYCLNGSHIKTFWAFYISNKIASLSKNPIFKKSIRGQSAFPGISYRNLTFNFIPTNISPDLDIFILFLPL